MNSKFPNPTTIFWLCLAGFCLIGVAQEVPPSSQEADELLAAAIERIQGFGTLQAKTRYSGRLYGQALVGTGRYQQQGRDGELKWHTEWNLHVGEKTALRRETCNGDSLWIEVRTDQAVIQLSRVNLRKIRANSNTEALVEPQLTRLGGFPGFLESLRANVHWTKAESSTLGEDRVWVLHGELKDVPKSPELPNHVRVVLAQTGEFEKFPFRVEWFHRSAKETKRTMVVDYFSISADETIPAADFEFEPGDRDFSDATDQYTAGR
jgi:hypothetical protein